ncbi:hypothetical protein DBV15_02004 [Temnothorax longispinosus]|uniref:Uncharacterized protein n=1 Tax=Temnothorax longispinosus TaxID=300112 RepID=A0A4S2KJ60_9HYME|nr:hypothetical protein DBV15_02004 [Temnothorax longispinosus]
MDLAVVALCADRSTYICTMITLYDNRKDECFVEFVSDINAKIRHECINCKSATGHVNTMFKREREFGTGAAALVGARRATGKLATAADE